MADLDKYRPAKKDIDFNQAPYRDNGTFHFTPGLEKILGQERYYAVRKIMKDLESLREERKDLLKEILHHRATYKKLEDGNGEKISSLEEELQEIEKQLDLKEVELERHIEHMDKRDVILMEEDPEREEEEKPAKPKKKFWKGLLTTVVGFAIADLVVLLVQWQVLRHQMSLDEIWIRTGGVAALGVFVHSANILYRKSGKVIYNIAQWFCFIMFVLMVFAPVTLNHFYPESSGTTEFEWSLEVQETSSEVAMENQAPVWVQLHRAFKEMAPVLLGIIVFLIAWLRDPGLLFRQKDDSQHIEIKEGINAEPVQDDAHVWAIKKWKQLKKEVHSLRTKKGIIEAQIQQQKTGAEDLIPLRVKLDSLEQKIKAIDESIRSKELELGEFLKALEVEINEYRAEYEDILSGDEVKQAILKPEWPETKDIINHFKVS